MIYLEWTGTPIRETRPFRLDVVFSCRRLDLLSGVVGRRFVVTILLKGFVGDAGGVW